MSKMIQIRHVPESLHKRLRARAVGAGMTLSDYLRMELEQVAGRLTPGELRARLDASTPAAVREKAVDAVRAERDSR
jgi:plasmid stability protein